MPFAPFCTESRIAAAMDTQHVTAPSNWKSPKTATLPARIESKIYQTIDAMHEELRMYREAKAGFALPKPAFKQGQSVLHWWASWMKTAKQTPATYNTKHRPSWYSAEVCTYAGFRTLRYAGQEYTENLYDVF